MIFREYSDFLFDLDGTLVDSFRDIKQHLEYSYLKILGRKVEVTKACIGPPLSQVIEQLTPDLNQNLKALVILEFKKNYDSSLYPLTTSMDGSIELLKKLTFLEKHIYVVTNKSYNPTQRILAKFDMPSFTDVMSPDKFKKIKYTKSELIKLLIDQNSLRKESTVMVGDTTHDVLAAKSNQIDSVSVASGYDSLSNLKGANPTILVYNMKELLGHLN